VVQRVRQRDVDRVDAVVGEELVVRAVRALDPVLVRVCLRPRRIPRADGDDLERSPARTRAEDRPVDPCGGEETEPDYLRAPPCPPRVSGSPMFGVGGGGGGGDGLAAMLMSG